MNDDIRVGDRVVLRPKQLVRAFWLPHLYAALLVVVAVWFVAAGLSNDGLRGQLRFSAACLQLVGLVIVVRGLWTRGTVFGKPNPIDGVRRFLTRVRAAFRESRSVEMRGGGSSITLSATATAVGRKAPTTLEERVAHLEADLKALDQRVKKGKERLEGKLRDAVEESRSGHRAAMKRVDDLRGDVETTMAGSYAWEWVAVFWLVTGMLQRVLAEAIA